MELRELRCGEGTRALALDTRETKSLFVYFEFFVVSHRQPRPVQVHWIRGTPP